MVAQPKDSALFITNDRNWTRSSVNYIHLPFSYLPKFHFNIILPPSSVFQIDVSQGISPQKFCMQCSVPQSHHCINHFTVLNDMRCRIYIKIFFNIRPFKLLTYFIPLSSKYFRDNVIFKHIKIKYQLNT